MDNQAEFVQWGYYWNCNNSANEIASEISNEIGDEIGNLGLEGAGLPNSDPGALDGK